MKFFLLIGLFAGYVAADVEDVAPEQIAAETATTRGRELFAAYAHGSSCVRRGCAARAKAAALSPNSRADENSIVMTMGENTKGPVKALEMMALNDHLKTVVMSDDMCTRRRAMSRAAGLAAGLALSHVNTPAFAAETKTVKMGADSGQLVFVPDEVKICSGDTVTWVNNKGGPHNVVFNADAIPSGVDADSISMDDQLGDEGATYSKSFATKGSYGYYCEPHAGAGMLGTLIVE